MTVVNAEILNSTKELVDLEGYSSEGGQMTFCYSDETLRTVQTIHYGETGKSETEYYFWNDSVFFIYKRSFHYNSPIYMTKSLPEEGIEAYDETKTKLVEDRFYLKSHLLFRWLDNNKNKVKPDSQEFIEKQKEIMDEIEFIMTKR